MPDELASDCDDSWKMCQAENWGKFPSATQLHQSNIGNRTPLYTPADTDVFKTSSGSLKMVKTSYDQTRRCRNVWKKTSGLQRLEDVWFMTSWRLRILRRLEDVQFTTSWRCLIYDFLKKSDLLCFEDVQYTTSWRRLISDVLTTSDLHPLAEVQFTMSVKRRHCSNVVVMSIQRQ